MSALREEHIFEKKHTETKINPNLAVSLIAVHFVPARNSANDKCMQNNSTQINQTIGRSLILAELVRICDRHAICMRTHVT